jgi:hypothetical protein
MENDARCQELQISEKRYERDNVTEQYTIYRQKYHLMEDV